MKVFLIVFIVVCCCAIGITMQQLATEDYPRTTTNTRKSETRTMLIEITWCLWAVYLLLK